VDVLVTTAGGVEEDFIKCLAPTYIGDFALPGKYLRSHGVNRIGNLLVPNDNYCKFEDWLMPILDKLLEEQKTKVRAYFCAILIFFSQNEIFSPSKIISRLGKEIDNPESIYYWCHKVNT
jgi:deoxyhypusine synthase